MSNELRIKLNELNLDMTKQYPCYQTEEFWDDLMDNGAYCDADYAVFSEHMKIVNIKNWMCTDTLVGFFAYFFDYELVCISFQPYRKSNMELHWVSKEAANKVKKFMLAIMPERKKDLMMIDDDLLVAIARCIPEDH
jgi:hypothetical protein